ncbi:methyltransferase regulatory domain-containing protein [Pseudochelatococcus sp. B33]
MSKWSEGYVTGIEYTIGFFHELTPENLRFALLQQGLATPRGPVSYLELGAGHGLTANLLAAVNPDVEVVAVDFNPAHISHARALAAKAGTPNVTFLERSFEELARDDSLQSFDFIVLHGVYSWVSEANRGYIRDIVRRNLKPGGVVYVSYNAYPGWSAGATLQRVLRDGGALGGGEITQQIAQGVRLLNRLKELNAGFFVANPGAAARLEDLQKRPLSYLAHEYMNSDWDAFFFSDVAKDFGEAKVTYAGQAHLASQTEALNFNPDQRQLLASISDPVFREVARDVILNTAFRRDIYLRGASALPRQEQKDIWNNQRFVLLRDPADVPRKIAARVGEVSLNASVYDPVIAALGRGPQTLAELVTDADVARLTWGQVTEALHVLVLVGAAHPALPAEGEAERTARAKAFNAAVAERVKAGDAIQVLASPITGSGIGLDNLSQLLFTAYATDAQDKAAFVRQQLRERGHALIKDGATIEDGAAEAEHLRAAIASFENDTLKVLRRAGIV